MEVTLEITQYCDHSCSYCSSNAGPDGEHLSFEEVKDWLDKNVPHNKAERINISGGEPLANPSFYKILKYCESLCDDVRVYTNALKHIHYNADIIDIKVDAHIIPRPEKTFRIPKNVNEVHFLKLKPNGRAKKNHLDDHVNFSVSGSDCKSCDHILLQADGKTTKAPCKKNYEEVTD
ncbi:MAG: radical SAM protein [Deltaproteobacteria bacterium]|nr:radical SAM protein [Deltaproteobacteria bacterium]